MKWLFNHTFAAWLAASLAIASVLISTTPERIGPQGVTVVFILFYVWSFFSFALAFKLFSKNRNNSLKNSNHFFAVAALASIPTFILALQSLGQLAIRDVFIVVSLAALIIFYWTKRGYN